MKFLIVLLVSVWSVEFVQPNLAWAARGAPPAKKKQMQQQKLQPKAVAKGKTATKAVVAARPMARMQASKKTPMTANRKPAQAAPEVVPAKPQGGVSQKPAATNRQALANTLQGLQTSSSDPYRSAGGNRMVRGAGGTHEIGEALRVTGQSRSLSMGLLFSKDGDKIEFGSPRYHYRDKISSKSANY